MRIGAISALTALLGGLALACDDGVDVAQERIAALEARIDAFEQRQSPATARVFFPDARASCDRYVELGREAGLFAGPEGEAFVYSAWLECAVIATSSTNSMTAGKAERVHACARAADTPAILFACYDTVEYMWRWSEEGLQEVLDCVPTAKNPEELEACWDD